MQSIPTIQTSARYRYRIELGGVSYVMVYRYNTRNNGWHLDLLDTDENPLHVGIKIVRNFPLFLRDVADTFPSGMTYGVSLGSGQVGRDGLVTRDTSMVLLTEAEYQALLARIDVVSPSATVTFTPVP